MYIYYNISNCIYLIFLYLQRSEIIQGNYEPTEEECDFPSDVEEDEVKNLSLNMEGKVKLEESKPLVYFIYINSTYIVSCFFF